MKFAVRVHLWRPFSVVGDEQVYFELLKASRLFPSVYEGHTTIESEKSVRRNMIYEPWWHGGQFSRLGKEFQRVDVVDVFDREDEAADDGVEMHMQLAHTIADLCSFSVNFLSQGQHKGKKSRMRI